MPYYRQFLHTLYHLQINVPPNLSTLSFPPTIHNHHAHLYNTFFFSSSLTIKYLSKSHYTCQIKSFFYLWNVKIHKFGTFLSYKLKKLKLKCEKGWPKLGERSIGGINVQCTKLIGTLWSSKILCTLHAVEEIWAGQHHLFSLIYMNPS